MNFIPLRLQRKDGRLVARRTEMYAARKSAVPNGWNRKMSKPLNTIRPPQPARPTYASAGWPTERYG